MWSSCHCGVNEKGVISKGTGGCPVSSFATGKKYKRLEATIFIMTTLFLASTSLQYEKKRRLQHNPSDSVIISTHKAQFLTFYSLP